MKGLFFLLVAFAIAKPGSATTGDIIARKAESYVGSRRWLWIYSYWEARLRPFTNKCNIFVADVLREVGAPAPNRLSYRFSPIGAREWGNSNSAYLHATSCWINCPNAIQTGDVIAEDGHVGIVSDHGSTISASGWAFPAGKIVDNDWGFRAGSNPTCWRYQCRCHVDDEVWYTK